MVIHIITYATHKEGLFEELINNKFGIEIKVLGFGNKWKGFTDKFKKCYNYILKLPEDDIIIFLDGFDTKINKNKLDELEYYLYYSGYKVIFSLERKVNNIENIFNTTIFNKCKNNMVANSGMYMGYNKYIQILLKDAISRKCKDDQVNINEMCHKYNFISIDINNEIFENRYQNDYSESKAMFISYPGTIKTIRILRGLKEYTQFFILYIILLNFLIIFSINLYKGRFLKTANIINILVYIIIFFYIDTSCIIQKFL